jgi:hypothetical protein
MGAVSRRPKNPCKAVDVHDHAYLAAAMKIHDTHSLFAQDCGEALENWPLLIVLLGVGFNCRACAQNNIDTMISSLSVV